MNFDTLPKDLLALADTGLKFAKSKGADQTEIFVSSIHNMNISNNSGIIDARVGINEGVGVRVALGKKLGFAAMSSLTDESIKHAVSEALSVVHSINEDNAGFESFMTKLPLAKEGILDSAILSLSTEDLVKETNALYSESKNIDPRIISNSATNQVTYGGYAVANSAGVSAATRLTAQIIICSVTATDGNKRKDAFDFSVTRTKADPTGLGVKCSEKAVALLPSKPLGITGVLPTVWNQNVMSGFWQASLAQSVDGRQVVEKNSYFMDKLADVVGIKDLTITDDGQLPEGLNTATIDYEGAPRQTTSIIDKGVLKSFLYDSYYGRLGKARSTGNANRGADYESTPNISPTTIVIQPGTKDFDAIISDIDKGLFVMDSVMGMGHSNLISGDFSVVANSVYLIENGEIKHPLESVTIAGNLYKSYQNIIALGSDTKLLPSVKTPSVAFDGFTVVG